MTKRARQAGHGGWRAALFLTALALTAVLSVAWAGVASAQSAATGTLEICKAPDNNAAGVWFDFTYAKGTQPPQSVSVRGDTCSSPLTVAKGAYWITEDLSSGEWRMVGASVTGGPLLRELDAAGKVKVKVLAGGETQVWITNAQAAATIKICKWSASSAIRGKEFSFTIGTTTVTATAGTEAHPGCSTAVTTQPGTRFTVTEAVPNNEEVAGVAASSNLTVRNVNGGVVKVTTGSGANVLTFDNEPTGPPQTGKLEVCKDAGDKFVSTSTPFEFTVTDSANATHTLHVLAGQCSGALTVAVGNVDVAETIPDFEYVSDIFLGQSSAGSLGPTNLNNGTATVVVPVASAGEAAVHFENSTYLTTLKICKYLTASSGALDGAKFNFTVDDLAGTQTVRITAQAGAAGACKNVTDAANSNGGSQVKVPIGSQVSVTEAGTPWVGVNGGDPGDPATKTITVGVGINTISFVNQAYGQFELCKDIAAVRGDPDYSGTVFSFVVDGGGTPVQVAAGRCGQPIVVPAGNVTVEETPLPYGWQFDSATATGGPFNQNRAVPPGANGNPITFSVPYFNAAGADGGSTEVHFTDSVLRASVKICKQIEQGSTTAIGGLDYSYSVSVNGVPQQLPSDQTTVQPPYPDGPNACAGPLLDVPIIQANGDPTEITVTETPINGVAASSITIDHFAPVPPGSAPSIDLGQGSITFNPAPGVAVVTYTNKAVPQVVYDAVPDPLDPNYPSLGYQANQTAEFGDYVHLAGTARLLDTVTVTFSTWARFSEYSGNPLYNGNSVSWTHPITVNVFNNHLDANGVPDQLLASVTDNVTIPWRPEGDPTCPDTGYGAGFAWRAADNVCYNGLAFNWTFDLRSLNAVLPNDVIVGIVYNTQTWGPSPIGTGGPYNSLNVAVPANDVPSVGTDDNADNVFWQTATAGNYADGGAGGVNIFREDTNWTPYGTVAFRITAI